MHPARDLKHVQTNSNCSMLAIKSKGTGHRFSNKNNNDLQWVFRSRRACHWDIEMFQVGRDRKQLSCDFKEETMPVATSRDACMRHFATSSIPKSLTWNDVFVSISCCNWKVCLSVHADMYIHCIYIIYTEYITLYIYKCIYTYIRACVMHKNVQWMSMNICKCACLRMFDYLIASHNTQCFLYASSRVSGGVFQSIDSSLCFSSWHWQSNLAVDRSTVPHFPNDWNFLE